MVQKVSGPREEKVSRCRLESVKRAEYSVRRSQDSDKRTEDSVRRSWDSVRRFGVQHLWLVVQVLVLMVEG